MNLYNSDTLMFTVFIRIIFKLLKVLKTGIKNLEKFHENRRITYKYYMFINKFLLGLNNYKGIFCQSMGKGKRYRPHVQNITEGSIYTRPGNFRCRAGIRHCRLRPARQQVQVHGNQ